MVSNIVKGSSIGTVSISFNRGILFAMTDLECKEDLPRWEWFAQASVESNSQHTPMFKMTDRPDRLVDFCGISTPAFPVSDLTGDIVIDIFAAPLSQKSKDEESPDLILPEGALSRRGSQASDSGPISPAMFDDFLNISPINITSLMNSSSSNQSSSNNNVVYTSSIHHQQQPIDTNSLQVQPPQHRSRSRHYGRAVIPLSTLTSEACIAAAKFGLFSPSALEESVILKKVLGIPKRILREVARARKEAVDEDNDCGVDDDDLGMDDSDARFNSLSPQTNHRPLSRNENQNTESKQNDGGDSSMVLCDIPIIQGRAFITAISPSRCRIRLSLHLLPHSHLEPKFFRVIPGYEGVPPDIKFPTSKSAQPISKGFLDVEIDLHIRPNFFEGRLLAQLCEPYRMWCEPLTLDTWHMDGRVARAPIAVVKFFIAIPKLFHILNPKPMVPRTSIDILAGVCFWLSTWGCIHTLLSGRLPVSVICLLGAALSFLLSTCAIGGRPTLRELKPLLPARESTPPPSHTSSVLHPISAVDHAVSVQTQDNPITPPSSVSRPHMRDATHKLVNETLFAMKGLVSNLLAAPQSTPSPSNPQTATPSTPSPDFPHLPRLSQLAFHHDLPAHRFCWLDKPTWLAEAQKEPHCAIKNFTATPFGPLLLAARESYLSSLIPVTAAGVRAPPPSMKFLDMLRLFTTVQVAAGWLALVLERTFALFAPPSAISAWLGVLLVSLLVVVIYVGLSIAIALEVFIPLPSILITILLVTLAAATDPDVPANSMNFCAACDRWTLTCQRMISSASKWITGSICWAITRAVNIIGNIIHNPTLVEAGALILSELPSPLVSSIPDSAFGDRDSTISQAVDEMIFFDQGDETAKSAITSPVSHADLRLRKPVPGLTLSSSHLQRHEHAVPVIQSASSGSPSPFPVPRRPPAPEASLPCLDSNNDPIRLPPPPSANRERSASTSNSSSSLFTVRTPKSLRKLDLNKWGPHWGMVRQHARRFDRSGMRTIRACAQELSVALVYVEALSSVVWRIVLHGPLLVILSLRALIINTIWHRTPDQREEDHKAICEMQIVSFENLMPPENVPIRDIRRGDATRRGNSSRVDEVRRALDDFLNGPRGLPAPRAKGNVLLEWAMGGDTDVDNMQNRHPNIQQFMQVLRFARKGE